MPEISEIFGSEKLSFEEFMKKAAESGCEFGDLAALRRVHEAEVSKLLVHGAVEREALLSGARNSELLMRVLDMSGITVDEEGVHGITEQIGRLRETDPYLFGDTGNGSAATAATAATATTGEAVTAAVSVSTGAPHGRERIDPDMQTDAEYYSHRLRSGRLSRQAVIGFREAEV